MNSIKVDDILELEIKRIGINGEGIGYYNRLAIFVDQALPNEVVEVKITELKDQYAIAENLRVIEESPYRLPVLLPDLAKTGSYGMQHVEYNYMLSQKREILINSLRRYLKNEIQLNRIKKTVGLPDPFGYRNKVSLPVRKISGHNVFGFYESGSNVFVPINESPVQHPKINQITQDLEKILDQFKFDAYIQKEKSGYLKSVVIRRTHYHGEIQVSFLVMKKFPQISQVVEKLVSLHPEIKSVYEFFSNDYKEQTFFTKDYQRVFGKDTINEKLNDQTFSLYPESFWQLNTPIADLFYQKMIKLAKLTGNEMVIDAYAGIAAISHYAYKDAKKIYAIEIDQKSVQSANLSLKRNHIKNVTVVQSDFTKALKNLGEQVIDVMFFDPPRGGLGYKTVKEIFKYKPRKIIYGSCNPSTLAKDLADLLKEYNLVEITPFDMFPFTPLVESVTLLVLKETPLTEIRT